MSMLGKNKDTSPVNASQPDWGVAISQITTMLWKLRAMPQLVVMVAHTKTVTIDKEDKEILGVFGKNLPKQISGAFDEIWYMKVTGAGTARRFVIQSLSSGSLECKTRLQLPDGCDVNLGMEGLLEKVGFKWPLPSTASSAEAKK